MQPDTMNCPQCGYELPRAFRFAKLAVCEQCDSTLFLEDDSVRLAGKKSVLAKLPSLIQLKTPFQYRNTSYLPVGYIRYSYRYGYWDEWWVLDNSGQGVWMSVDEGDFAFEHPQELHGQKPQFERLHIEGKVNLLDREWKVTELGRATCEGFRGELPEIIEIGDQFDYAHLSGPNAALLTLEFEASAGNEVSAYLGKWVDPFDIKVES